MFSLVTKQLALMLLYAAVAIFPVAAVAQSSGGSGGGSSGGGSSAGSAGGSIGGGRAGGSPSMGRSLGGSSATIPGTPNTNPNGFRNNASPTMPGLRTPAQENTRQRAMDLRNSEPSASQPVDPGDSRGRTSDLGQDEEISPNSGALPERVSPGRSSELNELSAGGSSRQGAVGRTMAECEGAWDAQTHMSKEKWRETCRRTLTSPHL